jgi:outer membrane protein OmpA-like peptidoglycan-associated protein
MFLLAIMSTFSQAQVNSMTYKLKNYTLFTDNSGSNKPNDDFIQGVEIGYAHGLNRYFDVYVPVRLGVPIFKSGSSTSLQQGTWGFDPMLIGKYDNGGKVVPYASVGFSGENIANSWNWGTLVGGGLNFRIADQTFFNVGTGFRKSFTAFRNSWQHNLGLILPVGGAGLDAEPKISAKQQAINDAAAERLRAEAAAKAQKAAAEQAAAAAAEAKMKAEEAEKLRLVAEAKARAEKERLQREAEARAAAEKAELEAEARKKAAVTPPPVVVTTPVVTTTTTTQTPVVLTQSEQEVMTYAMQGVQFETGSAQLLKSSYSVLDNVVSVLKNNAQLRLNIGGHTDNTGSESANVKLSQSRANACMAYLVSKGIKLNRLTAKGYGSSQPSSDNSTAEGRKANRRVEFSPY